MKLTEKQRIILEALARFKYLTTKQLQMILHSNNRGSINSAIRELKSAKFPLIKSMEFWVVPGKWRLAAVHHLTESGKRLLITKLWIKSEEVLAPKGSSAFFQRDYYHRLATIDFNIRFQQWIWQHGLQLKFFYSYFTKVKHGEQYRAITAIKYGNQRIEPDGLGVYKYNEKDVIFIFELHNGNDAKRAIEQIARHYNILVAGLYSIQNQVSSVARVIYLFEQKSCMEKVMKLFMADSRLRQLSDYFLFNHQENINIGFTHNWQTPAGKPRHFK